MASGFRVSVVAAFMLASAVPAYAEANSCTPQNNLIVSARTPEVDLFEAPTGGQPVLTMAKADFPSCLPILEQSPNKMLKVDINGKTYWVQPHTVVFKTASDKPVVCRKLAAAGDEAKTGSTRALGEGCN